MLASAETGRSIAKEEFEALAPSLRADLVQAQFAMRRRPRPVLLLLAGDDRPGANGVINRLHQWLDPRFLLNRTYRKLGAAERRYPLFWSYWNTLPQAGRIAFCLGGWARRMLDQRLSQKLDDAALARRLEMIRDFESTLAAEGAVLLKFWLHLPAREMRRRRAETQAGVLSHGYYSRRDVRRHERYAANVDLVERLLQETSLSVAPWRIVESTDRRFRDVTIAQTLLTELREVVAVDSEETSADDSADVSRVISGPAPRLRVGEAEEDSTAPLVEAPPMPREEYQKRQQAAATRISALSTRFARRHRGAVLVFEGWDAAGKGGVVRRLAAAMDAAHYRIHPIAAPNEVEQRYHYLWRFWTRLQPPGMVTIFDRSWYGRVLVERVEGFATPEQWSRAYAEINEFERQLAEFGYVLVKFWLNVSSQEQLRRFRDRENTPHKRFKITAEDWRNRDRRPQYEVAVRDMLARTGTPWAPWRIIESDDKLAARAEVLEVVADAFTRDGAVRGD